MFKKNIQKIICSILTCAIIITGTAITPVKAQASTADGLSYSNKKYTKTYTTESGKTAKEVSFKYPVFEGDSKAATTINSFVTKKVNKLIKYSKSGVAEARDFIENYSDVDGYYSDTMSVRVTTNDGKYIALLFEGYEYTMGAHGMPWRLNYIFDAKTGEQKKASDVLGITKSQVNSKVRSLYLKRYDKNADQYMFFAASRSELEKELKKINFNSGRCYMKNGKLIFYTEPYEVGPYAAGFIEVKITY